jgi:hypothetical protein
MFPAAHDGILDVAMTNMDFHHGPWQKCHCCWNPTVKVTVLIASVLENLQ